MKRKTITTAILFFCVSFYVIKCTDDNENCLLGLSTDEVKIKVVGHYTYSENETIEVLPNNIYIHKYLYDNQMKSDTNKWQIEQLTTEINLLLFNYKAMYADTEWENANKSHALYQILVNQISCKCTSLGKWDGEYVSPIFSKVK
jgi:hypothetical protein